MTIDQRVRAAQWAGIIQVLSFVGMGSFSLYEALMEPSFRAIALTIVAGIGLGATYLLHRPGGFYSPEEVRRRSEPRA